jgi:thiamine transporter
MAMQAVRTRAWDARMIAEVGVTIALASVLHMVKLWQMPQGGSITLGTMVPLFILAFRRGPAIGMIAGALYGIFEGWILSGGKNFYHPVQVVLDYPLAFGLTGLAGLFVRWPAFGVVVASLARYASHVVSGVVFFAQYAPKGQPVLLYSLGYNAFYLGPDFLIAIVLTLLVWERLGRVQAAPA